MIEKRMGVVADDVTGSNDIGIMFAKGGLLTYVYAADAFAGSSEVRPDICILDTNSRLDPAPIAYEKVFAATQALAQAGYTQFFNKTCSVFRGNIGVEFDAMLDALGQSFAVIVLGFPKNGRTTVDGIHYVHGKKLEDSEFRHDPIHPMTISNLVDILQAQTPRKVALLNHRVIAQGSAHLRTEIEAMRGQCTYLILDVPDQDALKVIARAVSDFPVLCGSSALAEELPAVWGVWPLTPALSRGEKGRERRSWGEGILCVAGSLMPQTAAQIRHLAARGTPTFVLDAWHLFTEEERKGVVSRAVAACVQGLSDGKDVIVHSPNETEAVHQIRAAGALQGWSTTEVARLVSETLAEVAAQVVEQTGIDRLIVAGGETSAAVCDRLGVRGMRIWREIQPGLPSCISLSPRPMFLVLKSGSFGSPDFFERAIEHLIEHLKEREMFEELFNKYPDLSPCAPDLNRAYEMLLACFRAGGKLLVCGNGGSAADSEHIVGELMKGYRLPRPVPAGVRESLVAEFPEEGAYLAEHLQGALPAISLVSHSALMTAFANDVAPDMIFAQQVYGYGKTDDVLLAISTSGNSENVLRAVQVGRVRGLKTVGLTGQSGGRLRDLCDVTICVPYEGATAVQERHLPVYHALCTALDAAFFGN